MQGLAEIANGTLVLDHGRDLTTSAPVFTIGPAGSLYLLASDNPSLPETMDVNDFDNQGFVQVNDPDQIEVLNTFANVDTSGSLNYGSFVLGGRIEYDGPDINTIESGVALTLVGSGGFHGYTTPANNHLNLTANKGILSLGDGAGIDTTTFVNSGTLNLSGVNAQFTSYAFTNSGTVSLTGNGATLTTDLTNPGAINLSGDNTGITDTGDYINNNGGSLALSANRNTVTVAG